MHRSARLGVTAALAAVVLSAMVASASANHLSISNQSFRVVWTSLRFETTSRAGLVLCPTTLEGTFHSASIAKTIGALVGYVTRASINGTCTGGTATLLTATLPWHVNYEGFTGSLPSIQGMQFALVGVAVQIHINGSLTCLAQSEVRNPLRGRITLEAGGGVTGITPESSASMAMTGEGGLCGLTRGVFLEEAAGNVSVLGTTTRITVTLI